MASQGPNTMTLDESKLDGSTDVLLAPVSGLDSRRHLPDDLFNKRPSRFTAKFGFAWAAIAGGWALIAAVGTWWADAISVALLGLLYAHLVELQHECLHEHAYSSRPLNRVAGFVCGVPMLSSYSHYKYEHLRHHAFLGTPKNSEFFNYRFRNLDNPLGFAKGCFHLGRYGSIFTNVGRSLVWRLIPGISKTMARRIRTEYFLFAAILAAGAAVSILTRSWLIALAWVAPTLLVAEPTHFLIELPEHFGLNTQTNPDVLANTRTVQTNKAVRWFTNGNDLHTAHHYHQGVPMAQVAHLDALIRDRVAVVDQSYRSFYLKVVRGELRYADLDQTCMTR